MSDDGSGGGREQAAIVTAAGSGRGAVCARELASRGSAVALMYPSGKAEDFAKTAAFLLSNDSGYITGQNVRVDGGLTRSA